MSTVESRDIPFNQVLSTGDKVKIKFLKNPIEVTNVGRHFATLQGLRGATWRILRVHSSVDVVAFHVDGRSCIVDLDKDVIKAS